MPALSEMAQGTPFEVGRNLSVAELEQATTDAYTRTMGELVAAGQEIGVRIVPRALDELHFTYVSRNGLGFVASRAATQPNFDTLRTAIDAGLPASRGETVWAKAETVFGFSNQRTGAATQTFLGLVISNWRMRAEYDAASLVLITTTGVPIRVRERMHLKLATSPQYATEAELNRVRQPLFQLKDLHLPFGPVTFD